jgi:AcrR family transcriptional regulator
MNAATAKNKEGQADDGERMTDHETTLGGPPSESTQPGQIGSANAQGDISLRGRRALARRKRIIAAARALFEERGFHNTSMSQLAARSGVLVGQIYRDFANKEAVVAEIVDRDLREYLLSSGHQAEDEAAGARAWLRFFVAGAVPESAALLAEIMAESRRNTTVNTIFVESERRVRSHIMTALTALFPASSQRDDVLALSEVVMTLGAGACHRAIAGVSGMTPEAVMHVTAVLDRELAAIERKHATVEAIAPPRSGATPRCCGPSAGDR